MAGLGIVIKTKEEIKSFNDLFGKLMSQSDDLESFSEKMLDHFFAKNNRDKIEKANNFFQKFVAFELYEDTKEIIDLPVKKAILSSVSDFLIKQSLPNGFEIFGSKGNKFHKPDPRAFFTVLMKMGVNPEDAVMVGDEVERDLIAAQKLGITTVLVDRKNEKVNYQGIKINSLGEIKKIFEL